MEKYIKSKRKLIDEILGHLSTPDTTEAGGK